MTTSQYIYQTKDMRDLAYETEKARGSKGVTRFTDQIEGKMVYILAVPEQTQTVSKITQSPIEFAQNTTLDLTTNPESDSMTSEGNPNV